MKLKNSVLLLGASIFIASCTNKSIPTSGESDDMYATSADAAPAPIVASSNAPFNKNNGVNTQQLPYEDEYDRIDNGDAVESTDDYYSEDYITTRDFKRKLTSKPGYSDGYADGYSQGWTDYSWSQPIASGWNSPFNRFGYNSFSPFNSGIFLSYGFGGGWNSWNRFSPWGFNSWNNPWMMDSWAFNSWGYSPWGFNSFYSPWGYNSFYSPWGFNDFYGNGFYNNYRPYYNNQAIIAQNAYRNGSRTYGARETGRNSSNYNDRFVNTNKPAATASSGRTSSSVRNSGNTSTTNGDRVLADRKNGTWVGNSSGSNTNNSSRTTYSNSRSNSGATDSYNPSSRRPASYDSYNRSSNSGSSSYSSRSASTNSTAQGNTYTRSSSSRSTSSNNYSSPSYNRSSSSSYSSPSSSNSGYSSGSSSRGSSSSSSSSGGSSSGGGSSRGPR